MPEILMIFVILVLLAIPVAIAIALFFYFNSRGKSAQLPAQSGNIQAKLSEIEALKAKNLITDSEYEAKRKQMIDGI